MSRASRLTSNSGLRRSLVRVTGDVGVVVARANGDKWQGRMLDVSVGGMQVSCSNSPEFGESLTLVVQLRPEGRWLLLPATVRWFTARGFGAAFGRLDRDQIEELAWFIDSR